MLPKVYKPFEKLPPGRPIVASKSKFVNVNIRPLIYLPIQETPVTLLTKDLKSI